ncbi:hypothetical protein [Rothia aerolata]|uniref:Uncharacterized protein n=1 Tax=Rothia aerolata TaxID=1812262 RepID=A0A917MTU3_9MICC|nr:hypothetical protein [Rothia aerolata]GGH63811.1 hypothetical protein GCM10007359_15480 [Rothia aerolata]
MSIPSYNPDHGDNYSQVPNDTQAISMGQQLQKNLKNHPSIKKLHGVMWASAAAYTLSYVANMFTDQDVTADLDAQTNGLFTASTVIVSIILIVVGLGLYFLVYSLINKGSNAGRITGTVFAALSVAFGLFGALGLFMGDVIEPLLSLIWGVLGIVWLVFAWKKDVTAALTPRYPSMH